MQASRRVWLKAASGAVLAAPLVMLTRESLAAKNDALRTALKYSDTTPEAGKTCANCVQFVPGKTAKDKGGCKILPGDTEIAPAGWCSAWVELKK